MGELSSRSPGADEAALARRAAAGDVHAFLTLYRRNERRVYELCHRILGSPEEAADATRETFVGVLRGAPGLLASAREACHRRLHLPGVAAHEREVLALCELEHLSYEEIAEIMGIDRDSVAQLHDWALAPEAEDSEDCERALPLIGLEQEGALDDDSNDAGWLEEHLMHCRPCLAARDAMQEAGTELVAAPGHRLRHVALIGALAALLVLALLVAVSSEGPLGLVVPAAEEEPAAAAPKQASRETAERPAEPAGSGPGKEAAPEKRSRRERGGRTRAAVERRKRSRRDRPRGASHRERVRRPGRSERVRRARTGGILAPPAEKRDTPQKRDKPQVGARRRKPRKQVQLERRPDRGGRDALVPAPSPVPPPSETAPAQPTPAPPGR